MDLFCGVCGGIIPYTLGGERLVYCKGCRTDFHRNCIRLKRKRIFGGYRQEDIDCPICNKRSHSHVRTRSEVIDEEDECGASLEDDDG